MALASSSMRATFAPKNSRHANTVAPKRAALITRAAALELPDTISKVCASINLQLFLFITSLPIPHAYQMQLLLSKTYTNFSAITGLSQGRSCPRQGS